MGEHMRFVRAAGRYTAMMAATRDMMSATRAAVGVCALAGALVSALAMQACGPVAKIRPGAESVLAVFAPPTREEAMALAMDEFDANKRFEGLSYIAGATWGSEPEYLQLFQDRLRDQDPGVRALASRALGSYGSPSDATAIADLMVKDADVGVRIASARALQRLHNPDVVPALFTALDASKEIEPRVRVEAASALGQYRETRVVERLIAAMADESLPVNLRVRDSLRTLTGADFGTSQAEWQAWYKASEAPLASAAGYTYPHFQRGQRWFEYIPFVRQPPNEPTGIPAGLSPAR
jgi:hypothetical protein